MAISHQVIPAGGWQYLEEKTNTTLIAKDWDSLVRHLKSHRANNGMAAGDIEGDIERQLEKKHPHLVI